jgi:aryl-alcohol dehydrogenase-like predicted oxidoreductase
MAGLETRRMGRTEMRPASLGLGAAWLGQGSERETIDAVHRAIDLGINYIDTYPRRQEDRWGKALEGGLRQKVYLQAKVSPPTEGGKKDFSASATRRSVENSLAYLKTDYLDSVLIHDPIDIEDPLAPGHALDELIKMKEKGFIRHLGLGVRQHEFHRRAIETGHIDIVLTFLDYTLLEQSAAQTTLPLARKHDVGIILASPMGMGALSGEEPNREDELRRARKENPDAKPQAHAMWKWCQTRDVNIRHLAVQFCLAAPIDSIVMFGPANKRQVEEGYEAATAPIPPEIWRDFDTEFGVSALNT